MEEDYKPTVQHQRRVNPKIRDVIKKEVEKLLDAGLIYLISDSPWVSPVHCVAKKGGMTVVKNGENDLIPTRLVTGWKVCIDYRKLNEATRKDHFPLPFMDQMLERLAGNEYYCFLDGFSGYFQIPIDPKDQEKTTFTCPYGTFAYRRMPFGLCNAPGTFQRCMMAIFHDMIEKTMEVFMDDFSVFGDSFSTCLTHLEKMLKRCEDTNLSLNWEKSHFMVKEGIVLGHKISKSGLEVDRAKVEVIAKLPHPTSVKGVRSFLGHAGFYRRFIQDFSKIARPMTHLLEKETPFFFSEECIDSFNTLKRKLTEAPILIAPDWDLPSTETSTASFSDATVYAFLSTQPQGSQLVHEDLEQLHDDDLEEMDLKWNMALLSMRARKFYQRTGRKIIIDGSSTAGYDKSKVECFNCHKMGHFARECRAPRSKDNRNWNQGSSSKAVRIEDASEKAMCAIDGAGFDWSDMAEEEIQANMALMAFSDSEVTNDKSCSKSCLQNYEALKKQYDDLLVKLDDTGFKASTYKRGLSILEGQILKYKESEVLFSEEIALLKRSVGHKEYLMGLLRTELEKVKEEKEGFEFKIAKFEKSSKDLDQLLASQINKKGFGYNVVPSPHPLILNRPTPLDLSYSGLQEFKQPEVNEYGPRDSSVMPTTGCDKESDNSKENTDDSLKQQQKTNSSSVKSPLKVDKDWKEKFFCPANQVREEEPKKARENNDAPIIEDWVSDDEDEVEPIPKVEKKTVIPTATKKEFVKPETPVRRSVRISRIVKTLVLAVFYKSFTSSASFWESSIQI
ncbi:reverse transcriptase domain-containing protein [Tanacetum coccineum]